MRICSICGERNEDWMNICQRCGNSVVNADYKEDPKVVLPPVNKPKEKKFVMDFDQKSNLDLKIVLAILLVILVCLLGYTIYTIL